MRYPMSDFIDTSDALQEASSAGHPVCLATMINWAKRDPKLGVKVGGRWRIRPDALRDILNGKPVGNEVS